MKLVFVLCPSYHGATLLSLLLNNHPEILALGDTIPTRKFDQSCACHQQVSTCSFWQDALRVARAERFKSETTALPTLPRLLSNERANMVANILLVLASRIGPLRNRALRWQPLAEYLDAYQAFRSTTLEKTNAHVFVDGQKNWLAPLVFKAFTRHEILVLHLTRDPRGFAHSMVRRNRIGSTAAARGWRRSHRLIGFTRRVVGERHYFRVRYEDLAQEPRATMRAIFDFLGVTDCNVVRPSDDPVKSHTIGNRMLKAFDGTVELDTRWRDALSPEDLQGIEHAAAPLMELFGYS